MEYSEDLIKRMQKYWKVRCKEEISVETAISYLDSLGKLYLSFWETSKDNSVGLI